MLIKQIIEVYNLLDDSSVTGEKVADYLRSICPDASLEVYPLEGPKGTTDMLKVRVAGTHG